MVLSSSSRLRAALLVALLAALPAGCGRRGDLEPGIDPSVEANTSAGDSVAPIVRRPKRVPITPAKDSFFLDPLL